MKKIKVVAKLNDEQQNKVNELLNVVNEIRMLYINDSIDISNKCGYDIFRTPDSFYNQMVSEGRVDDDFIYKKLIEKCIKDTSNEINKLLKEERKIDELLDIKINKLTIGTTNSNPITFCIDKCIKYINIPLIGLIELDNNFDFPLLEGGSGIVYADCYSRVDCFIIYVVISDNPGFNMISIPWINTCKPSLYNENLPHKAGISLCLGFVHFCTMQFDNGLYYHFSSNLYVKKFLNLVDDYLVLYEFNNEERYNAKLKAMSYELKNISSKIVDSILSSIYMLEPSYVLIPSITPVGLGFTDNFVPTHIRNMLYIFRFDSFYKKLVEICNAKKIELRVIGRSSDAYCRCSACGCLNPRINNFRTTVFRCTNCFSETDRFLNTTSILFEAERAGDAEIKNGKIVTTKNLKGKYIVYNKYFNNIRLFNLGSDKSSI